MSKRASNLLEEQRSSQKDTFDVAVIGAGYAGLSSVLLFGRYLIKAIIFDGGRTRNYTTKHVHGYLGFENASPTCLLKKSHEDVARYTSVRKVEERVTNIRKDRAYFTVSTRKRSLQVKYVIIATGVQDIKPAVKNFQKFDGNGAWHCPYCDGHEATGKRLAIIVSGKDSLSYAKEFLGWTRDIIVFPYRCRLSKKEKEEAAALGITIVHDTIVQIAGKGGKLQKQLISKSGRCYFADVIFYRLGYHIQNKLAVRLGCQLDEGYIKVNEMQETSIPNVYAAGDIDTDRHYVVLATAAGARAAISIYEKLLKEAIRAEMKGHKSF